METFWGKWQNWFWLSALMELHKGEKIVIKVINSIVVGLYECECKLSVLTPTFAVWVPSCGRCCSQTNVYAFHTCHILSLTAAELLHQLELPGFLHWFHLSRSNSLLTQNIQLSLDPLWTFSLLKWEVKNTWQMVQSF